MLQTGAEPWVDELRPDGSLVLRLPADARRTVFEFGQTPNLQTRFGPSAVERARRLNPPAVSPRRGCGSNRRQRARLKTAMHAADVSSLGDGIVRALSLRTSVESFFRPTSPYAFGNLSDGRQELLRRVAAMPRERSSARTMMAPRVSQLPEHRSFVEFRRSLAVRCGARWKVASVAAVMNMWRLESADPEDPSISVDDATSCVTSSLMQSELRSLKGEGVDLEAFGYWAEESPTTGHALPHIACNDHRLKSLSYSFERGVLGEATLRSEGRVSMLEVLEVLPLPMARAILRGAGDRQRSDMYRYYLQNAKILANLEEMGERNARRDERRFRFHECCGPEYELAVLARLRVEPMYRTATMLRVFRGGRFCVCVLIFSSLLVISSSLLVCLHRRSRHCIRGPWYRTRGAFLAAILGSLYGP